MILRGFTTDTIITRGYGVSVIIDAYREIQRFTLAMAQRFNVSVGQ